MTVDRHAVRRTIWLLLACSLLLVGFAAAAEPPLSADFDGDGRRDRAVLDHANPSLLRVWLSSTNATSVIRSQTPIIHLAASDLDGDRRSELIAGDRTGLRVWTRTHRDFRSYTPHHAAPAALAGPEDGAVHKRSTEPNSAVTWNAAPTPVVMSSVRPRAPTPRAAIVGLASASDVRSSLPHPPFAPRPPPQLA